MSGIRLSAASMLITMRSCVCNCVFLIAIGYAVGANKQMNDGEIFVNVLGQSGKILIWRQVSSGAKTTPLEILLDDIVERDANGRKVGAGEVTKHSFAAFSSLKFTLSDLKEGTLPFSNVTAKYITFDSQLKDMTSNVKLFVYIILQKGVVDLRGETQLVERGQVKFGLELRDWTWCGCEGDAQGLFVDASVAVKARQQPKMKGMKRRGRTIRFDMGYDSEIVLSQKVKVDNDDWTDMEDGYPMFDSTGDKNLFTFRFPRFTNKVYYDPTITVGTLADNSGTTMTRTCVTALLLGIVSAIFISMITNSYNRVLR